MRDISMILAAMAATNCTSTTITAAELEEIANAQRLSLSCASERERVMLAAVQLRLRRMSPPSDELASLGDVGRDHQRADLVVALAQLLGEVAEAQRHSKGEQLHVALVELAGHALGAAGLVVAGG
jgi:hypothetical protein